jgi:predicted aminopeptidase
LATELRSEHYDVFVGGVPAYSTLGWFDDPVLNTFVRYPEPEIARLIFHELAHQVAYAKGDSTFNESFAVTVEQEGVKRWLTSMARRESTASSIKRRCARRGSSAGDQYRSRLADVHAQPLQPPKCTGAQTAHPGGDACPLRG